MKNTITVTMDAEKMSALTMYMEQKGTTVEDELVKYAEQLYQKNVPQNVRDFIDMISKQQDTSKAKRKSGQKRNTDNGDVNDLVPQTSDE